LYYYYLVISYTGIVDSAYIIYIMHYGIKSNVARRLMVKVERLLGLWNMGEIGESV